MNMQQNFTANLDSRAMWIDRVPSKTQDTYDDARHCSEDIAPKVDIEMQHQGLVTRLERSRTSHSEVNPTDGSTAGRAFSCLENDNANGHRPTHANHIMACRRSVRIGYQVHTALNGDLLAKRFIKRTAQIRTDSIVTLPI